MSTTREYTIEAVIITCGEPQFNNCIRSIKNQTRKPDKISIVKNIHPISAALNNALNLASCDFYVEIAGDMILYKDALKKMYNCISQVKKNVSVVMYYLSDPYYGKIGHIKVFRTNLVKSVRYPNKTNSDRLMINKLKRKGYTIIEKFEVVGTHCVNPTPEQMFRRAMGTSKRAVLGKSNHDFSLNNYIRKLAKRWYQDDDEVALAGLIGFFSGLTANHDTKERDFTKFGKKEWKKIKWLFEQ